MYGLRNMEGKLKHGVGKQGTELLYLILIVACFMALSVSQTTSSKDYRMIYA
jgi:hypothetical protein